MRSSWIGGPGPNAMMAVLIRRGKDKEVLEKGHVNTEAEIEVMEPQV